MIAARRKHQLYVFHERNTFLGTLSDAGRADDRMSKERIVKSPTPFRPLDSRQNEQTQQAIHSLFLASEVWEADIRLCLVWTNHMLNVALLIG